MHRRWQSGVLFAVLCLAMAAPAGAQSRARTPLPGVRLPATDALGRRLPLAGEPGIRPPSPDRFLGILNCLWHDDHGGL